MFDLNLKFLANDMISRWRFIKVESGSLRQVGSRHFETLGDGNDRCILCFHSRGQHLCKFIGTKESVYPQDWFGTQTWPPFHCFGTQIWPP